VLAMQFSKQKKATESAKSALNDASSAKAEASKANESVVEAIQNANEAKKISKQLTGKQVHPFKQKVNELQSNVDDAKATAESACRASKRILNPM